MSSPILDISNLTEIIFKVILIVLLINIFILVSFKKLQITYIIVLYTIVIASTHMLVLCDGIFQSTLELSYFHSIHIGLILGLPAILLLTMGALLVLYNEQKYVLIHGYFVRSFLILSLINVILLTTLTPQMILDYSGLTHSIYIIHGGLGMVTGFASMLYGIAAQRHIAKLTGILHYFSGGVLSF